MLEDGKEEQQGEGDFPSTNQVSRVLFLLRLEEMLEKD